MTARRLLIAVVDDDESVQRALTRMLKAAGFDVAAFASGREFLNSLRDARPACVILDYETPGMTAPALQRRLQSTAIHVPVVIMTAHDDPRREKLCRGAGAIAYLVKPVTRHQLLASIDGALA